MTIAKKKKILKILLFTSLGAASVGIIGTLIYATKNANNASQNINTAFREDDPKLNKNDVVIKKEQNSNTDSNLTPIKKDEIITTLIFKHNNEILFTKKVSQPKDENTKIDIKAYIPTGWILDPEFYPNNEIEIQNGNENSIQIKKESVSYETSIVFVLDNKVFSTISIKTTNNETIDLEKYIPKGYKFKDDKVYKLEIGVTNRIPIEKILIRHTTTLIYKYNQGVVAREVVETLNDEKIDYLKYLPKGYEIDKNINNEINIILDNENNIFIRPSAIIDPSINNPDKKDPTELPEQPEDKNNEIYTPVNPSEKPKEKSEEVNKIKTILRFTLSTDDSVISEVELETSDNEVLDFNVYVPTGFIIDKAKYASSEGIPTIEKGKINTIFIIQEKKVITTTLKFFLNGSQFGETLTFKSLENEPLNTKPSSVLPEGYKLEENQNDELQIGIENRLNITKIIYEHTTKILFKEGNVLVESKSIKTIGEETIDVHRHIPNGYELDESKPLNIVIDQENTIYIKRIPAPKPEPKPIPNPKPNPKPDVSTLAPRNTSGVYVTSNYAPEINETTMKPTNPKALSAEAVRAIEKDISDLDDIYNVIKDVSDWASFDKTKLNELIRKLGLTGHTAENFKEFVHMLLNPEDFPNLYKQRMYMTKTEFEKAISGYKRDYMKFANKGMKPVMEFWQHWPSISGGGVWTYADEADNPVLNKYIEFNKNRYFSSDSKWMRTSGDLLKGDYKGWNKTEATKNYADIDTTGYDPYNPRIPRGDGIKVYEYRPNADNNTVADKNQKIYMAWLDASNPKGYAKFLDFITKHKEITAVTIENIGLLDKNQEFDYLLSKLPNHVKKLTLFFETSNTQSISALKNKHLDDVEILTKSPNVSSSKGIEPLWGIDPIGFRYTKNVSFDYNNNSSGEYASNTTRAGSIQFNIIRPSASDTEAEVKEAFRIAYVTKKDWKIFQGSFGDGSWPTWIDLSLQPNFRSLKGLELANKVFYNLKLHNDSEIFTVTSDDIHLQQWDKLIVRGPDRAKLTFDNPNVNALYIKGLAYNLPANYNPQFFGLFEAGKDVFDTLYVDNQAMKDAIMNTQAWRSFGSHFRNGIRIIESSNNDNSGDLDNGI
ncbi:putative immunoglobulin-blocking virulence protein [[Mycoplasma] anseris]|uniref:Putative immunoglobulin-blocking virulence protein n=1 Tax=[Mycoplasma] anseris TaxID=92400 RepID=A0A2Z4NCV9_9BACT|nr:putative immunoglobulin-blocking virulence protein [[Mycoplasma] anseris]AWX69390.1 putative immunoglobulin-blocking virulence protein [[Mycoplasma] anseris]